MYNSAKSVFWKVVIIWIVFALLHYAYRIFPHPITALIGEKEGAESIFGHVKMNFWTYLIVTIGEFLIFRKKILDLGQFWSTRLLSAVIYPWFALTFWMTGSAIHGGAEPARPVELAFSFIANAFGAYLTVRLEQIFDKVKFRKATQWTIIILFLMALIQYIVFELKTPWWNYFGSH
jgi:hypothetical protein